MQRRDPVVVAWAVGIGLAVLAYAVGPQHFLFRVLDWFHFAAWRLGEIIADLSRFGLDLVRALAIGLYATFLILGVAVLRRGGRARGALIVVTLLFAILVGNDDFVTDSNGRWAAALALSTAGALVMTSRLRHSGMPVPRAH
jgi:hypothetical protein